MSNLCEEEIGENEVGKLLTAQMGSRAVFKDISAALNNTTFWHFLVETSEPRICHSLFELFLCHCHSPYDESFKNAELEMRPDVMAPCSTLKRAAVSLSPISTRQWRTLIRLHG